MDESNWWRYGARQDASNLNELRACGARRRAVATWRIDHIDSCLFKCSTTAWWLPHRHRYSNRASSRAHPRCQHSGFYPTTRLDIHLGCLYRHFQHLFLLVLHLEHLHEGLFVHPVLALSPRRMTRVCVNSQYVPHINWLLWLTVAIRNYIATLKHSIRQQTAQLHSLENIVLSGPRPYPPGIMSLHSPSSSTVDSSTVDLTSESTPPTSVSHDQRSSTSSHRMSKRSSFEKLHIIAGPDSNLPLPMRECSIREGVPMEFGDAKPGHHKRVSSPTRTYSRMYLLWHAWSLLILLIGIPKSSVGWSFSFILRSFWVFPFMLFYEIIVLI